MPLRLLPVSFSRRFLSPALFLLLAASLAVPASAQAQDAPLRFGVGVNLLPSASEGLGIGLRGRVSNRLNDDVSLALDGGITGYFLTGGYADAAYVFDPQFSVIVTIPTADDRAFYGLAGVGAYVAFGETSQSTGPSIHLGIGRVHLLNQTTFFYEINPTFVIASDDTDFVLPLRAGIIF